MKINYIVNIIYKALWFILFFLIITFDRSNKYSIYSTLGLLIFLTIIAVIRAINLRNEWRPIAEEYFVNNIDEK
jgi:magnesium-transporting ATPase (P-type)